jgi:co-chaperonin GroES (HSP10)
MIDVIPFGDRMLVKFLPKEKVIGSLILPDIAGQRSWLAEVMACGELATRYKVGEIVLLSFYTGIVINLYENNWISTAVRMVTQEEVLGLAKKREDVIQS